MLIRRKAVRRLGFKHCFAEDDLYTVTLNGVQSQDIEKVFFGVVDSNGRDAVEYFTKFEHPYPGGGEALQHLMFYMSTQKFRTPKGLAWAIGFLGTRDKHVVLDGVIRYGHLFSAVWAESCWQIADATHTETKFIVSDHPVTVYNRRCGPKSRWCSGTLDPDIRHHATHTIFPLTYEKVLILTNLSWARNPYQPPLGVRPNPVLGRNTAFYFNKIQVQRYLNDEEVRQINLVIKSRAHRCVAAAQEEWLYPEASVSQAEWSNYGAGYLLMPDPRALAMGGTVVWGGGKGGSGGIDEYGILPWEQGFEDKQRYRQEAGNLYRFQGEFARRCGPNRRGRSFGFSSSTQRGTLTNCTRFT